jgi:divalent metal cation (Fe/Co/Zn/Cd) transporter
MDAPDNPPRGSSAEPSAARELAGEDRPALIRRAFVLEGITIGWMIVEATVALAASIEARSLSLLAFGLDSAIELISAAVLIWRLVVELKRGRAFSERTERTASRAAGGLLLALALYVVGSAAVGLWRGVGQEFSVAGFALALAAIPIMWVLSRKKLALAEQLESRALRADAFESIACGYLSIAVVVGLLAQLVLDAWWVDSVTSLAIVYFLVKEGREAWQGDDCCDD